MEPLYVTLAAVAVTLIALILWRIARRRPPRPRLPFVKRPSLLTPAEQRFFRVPLQAIPKGMTASVSSRSRVKGDKRIDKLAFKRHFPPWKGGGYCTHFSPQRGLHFGGDDIGGMDP